MKLNSIRWGLAVAGFLAAEATLIAAAFGWVAIYSYLLHPGETVAFYEEYAQTASPYVALILGVPVFYAVCRWAGSRAPAAAYGTAMAIFGIFSVIEIAVILAADSAALPAWFVPISLASKFMACHWGGKLAVRTEAQQSA